MKIVEGGVCAPKGFLAAAVCAQIKKNNKKNDLALIFSEAPAIAAGVFTTNKIKASCVKISKEHLKNNIAQAIIVNSGNANCCTGAQGFKDAKQTAQIVARALSIQPGKVLVSSTGVIGKLMPMANVINNIPKLVENLNIKNGADVAVAMLTTDKVKKEVAVRFKLGNNTVNIGAAAKGSGMICPNMATMLCFVTTDADIEAKALNSALKYCAEKSFNSITVDGDTSTNDMVLILANGASGNKKITINTKSDFEKFRSALLEVMVYLAKMIAKDGEGATKLVEVSVKGAKTDKDAKLAVQAVSNSSLVKTAIYGQDANWGRIAAALGRSGAALIEDKLVISLDNEKIFSKGAPTGADEAVLKDILSKDEIKININLGLGKASATMWTCDLSEEYIRINAKYRT